MSKMYHFHPGQTYSRREWDWGITTTSRLPGAHPVSGKQHSSRVDQWEAMCFPMDISQNVHAGSRVKGSKWRIMSTNEFSVRVWQPRNQCQPIDASYQQHTWMRSQLLYWWFIALQILTYKYLNPCSAQGSATLKGGGAYSYWQLHLMWHYIYWVRLPTYTTN